MILSVLQELLDLLENIFSIVAQKRWAAKLLLFNPDLDATPNQETLDFRKTQFCA